MRKTRIISLVVLACILLCIVTSVAIAGVGDSAGTKTGTAQDIIGATTGAPTANDLKTAQKTEPFAAKVADVVGQNKVAMNLVWLLVTGFLVMYMQTGFALLETGLTRAKNAAHTMLMNIGIYGIGVAGFFICGFAIMYGNAGPIGNLGGTPALNGGHELILTLLGKKMGLMGTSGFFLKGEYYDVAVAGLFLFQMVFMDTAATIPTGAMAERWKFSSFIVYGFFMSMFLYPMFGNWTWGGGWLSQLGTNFGLGNGYVDFAGSGVVHAVGGLCALAGAMVLGARIGKLNKDGSVNPIPGHHIPMAITGALILGFGWFGFNPGSMLGASGSGNLRIAIVAANTMLASATGMIAAMIYMYIKTKKPDATMCANGFLAGLVAITAPCAFVSPSGAFIIGAISGILVCAAVAWVDKLRVDDPVGAVAVHACNGLWGVISVGLFADGSFGGGTGNITHNVVGLFNGGGISQLIAQLIGCCVLVVWAFGLSWVFFKVLNAVMGLRVSREVEIGGLDLPETGVLAYNDFEMKR